MLRWLGIVVGKFHKPLDATVGRAESIGRRGGDGWDHMVIIVPQLGVWGAMNQVGAQAVAVFFSSRP